MSCARIFGVLLVELLRVEALVVGSVARVADVVGGEQATVRVPGVVDRRIHITIEVAARVNDIEHRQSALEGPRREPEIVLVVVRRKAIDRAVAGQIGVVCPDTFGVERLLRMLQQQLPVVVDEIRRADAYARIGRVVEVLFDELVVARCRNQLVLRVGQRPAGDAIDHDSAAVPAAVCRVVENVVDPATLAIVVGSNPDGEALGHGNIDVGLDRIARLTTRRRRVAHVEAGLEFSMVRFVSDEPDGAGLRAGSEQGALGAGQDFDAFQVRRIDVEITPLHGNGLLVEI